MPDKHSKPPIITLTSDFGTKDQYVGAMKAVILGIQPYAQMVDISHEIPPQDIMAAAWVIKNAAFHFPPGSVHLAVIDPGVGTRCRPIAVKIKDQLFVGPDNGLFSLIADHDSFEVVELTNKSYWYSQRSNTFHGRDVFAPVSAHLAGGIELQEVGTSIKEIETYRWAIPTNDDEGIQGWVVHIDAFGNLITNISGELIDEMTSDSDFKIYVGNTILDSIVRTFASVPEGEPAAVVGSSGMLEIIINKGDAAQMLSVQKGAPVDVLLKN